MRGQGYNPKRVLIFALSQFSMSQFATASSQILVISLTCILHSSYCIHCLVFHIVLCLTMVKYMIGHLQIFLLSEQS